MKPTDLSTLERMVDAIQAQDCAALSALFAADITLRASLPRRDVSATGPQAAAEVILSWFDGGTDIVRVHHTVDAVGDRGHAGFRFTVRENGTELVVEQHAVAIIAGGLMTDLRILCSGFRPAASLGAD
jgi:hypothetical protein